MIDGLGIGALVGHGESRRECAEFGMAVAQPGPGHRPYDAVCTKRS